MSAPQSRRTSRKSKNTVEISSFQAIVLRKVLQREIDRVHGEENWDNNNYFPKEMVTAELDQLIDDIDKLHPPVTPAPRKEVAEEDQHPLSAAETPFTAPEGENQDD